MNLTTPPPTSTLTPSDLLERNRRSIGDHQPCGLAPDHPVIVVTCVDARTDPAHVFDLEPERPSADRPPMLSIFGGKITTYRKLAEHALDRLVPYLPRHGQAWTASAPLPGGDIANADFPSFLGELKGRHPWLTAELAQHYGRLYGSRADDLLAGAEGLADLGRHFGGRLYEREARYLIEREWARSAEDILERRSKHGLHLSGEQRAGFVAWLEGQSWARSA